LAAELSGDTIAANMLMVGYAWQKGLLPLKMASILAAIELNAVAVDFNRRALDLGRTLAASTSGAAPRLASYAGAQTAAAPLDELIADRHRRLVEYQDERYANRYRQRVLAIRDAEMSFAVDSTALTRAVAHNYARLLAYKDEYEVARLYTGEEFRQQLARSFTGRPRLSLLLAPPALFKWRPGAAPPRKREFGPWIFSVLRVLARLKRLRGTPLDVFGYTDERVKERQLIVDYERLLDELLTRLSPDNHALAVELACLPEQIRGFGHVKWRATLQAKAEEEKLLLRYRNQLLPAEAQA
jgi:indolepyruvate ferredoxin oxidoreductase